MDTLPCSFKTAITPTNIIIARNAPAFMAMFDTLGRVEYESTAAHFVAASQDAGNWVGFVFPGQTAPGTDFAKMIELGFLSETQVEDGWFIALTPFAIEQVYIRQTSRTIRYLEGEVERARNAGFWAWCRKFFARRPAFA